nr:Na+/H+ antiporter NhaC family protein [Marinicella rhabdoformis]
MVYLPHALQVVLFFAVVWVSIHARLLGFDVKAIRQMMNQSLSKALPAFYIFLLIGMVIASLMKSGTIAALIYYGLSWLSPELFLPIGFVLCALMSLATGTSWGTVGTLGLVFVGMASAVGVPLYWVAGMVISGATFGDKMSPISDTTNLAAMSADVNLYSHISSMLYTTVPTFVIVFVIYLTVGLGFESNAVVSENVLNMKAALASSFELSPWVTLLPVLVLFVLSFMRFSPEVSMVSAVFTAMFVAMVWQPVTFQEFSQALWKNSPVDIGHETLNQLLGRGGLYAMAWTLILAILAMALGGVLHGAGFLKAVLQGFVAQIKRAAHLVTVTIATAFMSILALSEGYVAIILNGQVFSKAFDKLSIDRKVLSRSLEEGITLTAGLIPWSVAGAFYTGALGVSVLDYAPYALLNWLNPLIAVVFAYLGIGLFRHKGLMQDR